MVETVKVFVDPVFIPHEENVPEPVVNFQIVVENIEAHPQAIVEP